MRAAALWTLRLWCVIGWVFFMPIVVVRLMSTLFHHFGA